MPGEEDRKEEAVEPVSENPELAVHVQIRPEDIVAQFEDPDDDYDRF